MKKDKDVASTESPTLINIIKKYKTVSIISFVIITIISYFVILNFSYLFFLISGFRGVLVLLNAVFLIFFMVSIFFLIKRHLDLFNITSRIEHANGFLKSRLTTYFNLLGELDRGYYSRELIGKAIISLNEKIESVKERIKIPLPFKRYHKITYYLMSCSLVVILILFILQPVNNFLQLNRFLFNRKIIDKDLATRLVLRDFEDYFIQGSNYIFRVTVYGELPDIIEVYKCVIDQKAKDLKYKKHTKYTSFKPQRENTVTIYGPDKPFKFTLKYGEREVGPYTVKMRSKPKIESIHARVIPPAYSGLKVSHYRNFDFQALEGSTIHYRIIYNKRLQEVQVHSDIEIKPELDDRTVTFKNLLKKDFIFSIKVMDHHGLEHESPRYSITAIKDKVPVIYFTFPAKDIELDNLLTGYEIPLSISAKDDFGLKNVWLEIYAPDNIRYEIEIYKSIKKSKKGESEKEVEVKYSLDLVRFNLSPGDSISYRAICMDIANQKGSSKTYIVYYRKVSEDIEDVIAEEESIIEELVNIKEEQKKLKEELVDLSKESLEKGSKELSWEEKERLQQIEEQQEKLQQDVTRTLDRVEDLKQRMELKKYQDADIIEKYEKIQELMKDVLSDRIKDILEQINKMLEKNAPLDMQDLKDMKFDSEDFERNLDRIIEELKRLKIEKKFMELISILEETKLKQKQAINQMELDQDETALQKQSEIGESLEWFEERAKELNKDLEQFDPEMAEEFESSVNQKRLKELEKLSKSIEKNMAKGKKTNARESSQEFSEKLEQMSQELQEMLEKMKAKTANTAGEMLTLLIAQGIANSRFLEELKNEFDQKGYENIEQVNLKLNSIERGLNSFLGDIYQVAAITLMLDPRMERMLNSAIRDIENTRNYIREKNLHAAGTSLNYSYNKLNNVLLELIKLSDKMAACSQCNKMSLSQFLQKLEKLSQNQSMLNEYLKKLSEKLGERLTESEKQQIAKMLAEQELIRQLLSELNEDFDRLKKEEGLQGDLRSITEDMEEVIDSLKKYDLGEGTQRTQKQILSRMLQLETSIYKKQFSQKRLSESAHIYEMLESGSQIPEAMRYSRELMERYTDEPYPREYEELIREYYKKLSE